MYLHNKHMYLITLLKEIPPVWIKSFNNKINAHFNLKISNKRL